MSHYTADFKLFLSRHKPAADKLLNQVAVARGELSVIVTGHQSATDAQIVRAVRHRIALEQAWAALHPKLIDAYQEHRRRLREPRSVIQEALAETR